MTSVDPLIGRDLNGRYTIIDQVGRGNMGAVYRATQHGLGREVAIKVVTPRLGVDSLVVKRFLREAKLASKLSHPNAVAVLDFGQTNDGLIYLVMELVKGHTLDDVIRAEGRLSAARVVRIGSQICDALEGAHALQIIHRDLKPANIMVMTAGRDIVKVLDFGLAKSLQPDQASLNMTSAGALLGTPAFMPPESVTGGVVDARADLYSLGCTLYFAAMGKLPFDSPAIAEMIAMHAMEPPPPLVGCQVGLARVIEKLMAKSPAERYPDVAATRDALEESLSAGKEVVQQAARSAAMEAPPSTGTMLGWATPPVGTPVTKPRTDSQPIARPRTDAVPVVKIRTGETPAVRPGSDPANEPPAQDPGQRKPTPTPMARIELQRAPTPLPMARVETQRKPTPAAIARIDPRVDPPTPAPSPGHNQPTPAPMPRAVAPNATLRSGDSVPIVMPRSASMQQAIPAAHDLPLPSPSAVVPSTRADTEIDPTMFDPAQRSSRPPMNAQMTTIAPRSRHMVIAWTVIIGVMVASAAVIVYKLATTYL
jgi:hypothetical protein